MAVETRSSFSFNLFDDTYQHERHVLTSISRVRNKKIFTDHSGIRIRVDSGRPFTYAEIILGFTRCSTNVSGCQTKGVQEQ